MTDCRACLIAETSAQLSTLEKMVARTGFGQICAGLESWRTEAPDAPPVTYFFFHYRADEDVLESALAEIRARAELNIRFSPAIAVVGDCSEQDVLRMIDLGFDDIVVLPEAPRILRQRFAAQLDAPFTYFETSTYFGPDRRRAARDPTAAIRRQAGPSEHVRYLIRRGPRDGIRVLRREIVVSGTRPLAMGPAHATPTLH
jgi:hypothetical protein